MARGEQEPPTTTTDIRPVSHTDKKLDKMDTYVPKKITPISRALTYDAATTSSVNTSDITTTPAPRRHTSETPSSDLNLSTSQFNLSNIVTPEDNRR